MHARRLLALWICLPLVCGWGERDAGQSPRTVPETGLLPIDEAAFELAAATGGFYCFWGPGEFAALDPQAPRHLFAGGRTVEQIDGRLEGTIDLPFEVLAGDATITLRAGMQSRGRIELFAPGERWPWAGGEDLRTAYMRIVHLPQPIPGTWTVRLTGAGRYLVNVTSAPERVAYADEADADPLATEATDPRDDRERFERADPDERWSLLRRLPPERRSELARSLLDDDDSVTAYLAAGLLAREGHLDEAVPVFARILVRGANETALHGRMGYDWIHADDPTLADRILAALGDHLRTHLDDYKPAERERALRLLRSFPADPRR